MKYFTKLAALALSCVMLLTLTACGGSAPDSSTSSKITFGTSADYPPFEFIIMNEEGKPEYQGIDVALAGKIAEDMDVQLDVVNMSFDNLLTTLQKGDLDMVISGIEPTPAREKVATFSDPYYTDYPPMVLVRADEVDQYTSIESFNGKTVGAQNSTTKAEIVSTQMTGATLLSLSTVTDLVNNLQYDKCDAIVVDGAVALKYAAENDTLAVAEGVSLGESYPYCVVVAKDDPKGLLPAINASIADAIEQGLIEQWSAEAEANSGNAVDVSVLEEAEAETAQSGVSPTSFFNFTFLPEYTSLFVQGVEYTLLLSICAVLLSIIPALLLAVLRLSNLKVVKFLAGLYIDVFRSTPLMVQLSIIYFGLFNFIKLPSIYVLGFVNLSMFVPGVLTLSLNSSAYVAEIFRAGILAVDAGQEEAARSLGLTKADAMIMVVIPQAIKNVLPALANEIITMVKESSICSTFGMVELMWAAKTVASSTYITLGPYVLVALIYFCINYPAGKAIEALERRMRRGDKR